MTQQAQQLIKDRYRILETIGQGGFGKTYKASDTSHPQNKLCVIKQFTFQGSNKDTALALFYKEAEHLKALGDHDQIPALIDCFDENGQIYLVQQYIDGHNLEEELATEGVFSQQKIKELLDSLLPILDFLHTGPNPIIHRDIKPANIIRRRSDGQFVLVDFGAVKVASETLLAKTGTSIGSPEYVAPEQLRGKPTFASDIYGLGVTCIHLLTNNSPWMLQTNDGDWCWRSFLNGNAVDGQLVKVLDKMIEPRLSARYRSAAGVMEAIPQSGRYANGDVSDKKSHALREAELAVKEARIKLLKSSKKDRHDLISEEQLCEAEQRLRSITLEQQSSVSISVSDFEQMVGAKVRRPKIFGDNATMIWLSKNRQLVNGVGQITIALTLGLGGTQVINAFLSVGVTSWYIPISKLMLFYVTFIF
jgi:serine/threonine protein kinase